jgi:hypothetical protein
MIEFPGIPGTDSAIRDGDQDCLANLPSQLESNHKSIRHRESDFTRRG